MNDRLQIASAVPADRSEVLSDLADKSSARFFDDAREDLIEKLLDGKNVGTYKKFWLRDVLDIEDDRNHHAFMHDLAERFAGICSTYGDDQSLIVYSLKERIETLVTQFVDDHADLINSRAEEMAEEAMEDEQ